MDNVNKYIKEFLRAKFNTKIKKIQKSEEKDDSNNGLNISKELGLNFNYRKQTSPLKTVFKLKKTTTNPKIPFFTT